MNKVVKFEKDVLKSYLNFCLKMLLRSGDMNSVGSRLYTSTLTLKGFIHFRKENSFVPDVLQIP